MRSSATTSARAIVPPSLLRGAAALVFAASLTAGGLGIFRDLKIALGEAGPSNLPTSVARQIAAIQRTGPAGQRILLVSSTLTEELWYTRLFQRVLDPRNAVIIRHAPLRRGDADALRRRWSIRYGLAFGATPPDIGFFRIDDLRPPPAVGDHQAYPRLLEQPAPAAVALVVIGYARVHPDGAAMEGVLETSP